MTDTIDHEGLRRRYRAERDKRLRPDGSAQYVEPTGRFAPLLADPYTVPDERPPRRGEVEVVVIGAGFAGLATGAMLVEAGVDDLLLVDGAGGVGGVWYWNRYPGAMCDTASMVYLPLLEETGTVPSMKYVSAPEIHAHAERMATRWDLHRRCLLSTQVRTLEWDDGLGRWRVGTDRGDELLARYVTLGTGPLHRPKLPGIPGLEEFAGSCFHTARWDYGVTGGDPSGAPMTGLAGRRVGIIGTGATAVQVVPVVARDAGELYVFQRTPSAIDVRANRPIDRAWFASLDAGWQSDWLMNFAVLQTGGAAEVDLVQDGWTDISQRIWARLRERTDGGPITLDDVRAAYESSDDEKMEEIRARVDEVVVDPATAAALKPWYRQLCKRPCFHDEYLQAFNRDNVHLVDTDGRGVRRIDAGGCWVGERHVPLDVLVVASGFEVGTDLARRCGFETVGRGGRTLSDHWADGMRSLHGMHVAGFPNLFVVGPQQQANLISNITHNQVEAARTIAAVLAAARDRGATRVEVTPEAEAAWIAPMADGGRLLADPDCTPGYYNNEGGPIGRRERLNSAGYPEGAPAYFAYIDRWRSSGGFEGLAFR